MWIICTGVRYIPIIFAAGDKYNQRLEEDKYKGQNTTTFQKAR